MRYAEAGVDISRAEQAKERIRRMASRTFTRGVVGGIGAFGGLFALDVKRWHEPVLVSSTDGVGTKLKIAAAMGIHSTVGGDLVNHCVNDILTLGAEPLFFLDYLALGRMDPDVVEQLVDGITRACHQADCALVGGETAELPDTYAPGEYDLAGFIVGVVERSRIPKTSTVRAGDVLLALPSLGLHTNGYSLARKLVFETAGLAPDAYVAEISNKIGAELLMPHRCYWPALKNIISQGLLTGMAHITGGGIPGNLPRVLPRSTGHDPDYPAHKPAGRRNRTETPPREVLPHRRDSQRRLAQIAYGLHRLSAAVTLLALSRLGNSPLNIGRVRLLGRFRPC